MVTPVDIDQFAHRVLQDAFIQATADYWRRRANQLREVLRPRPNDFLGRDITPEQVEERRRHIRAQIEAFELRAQYAERYGLTAEEEYELERAIREVA